MVDWAIRLPSDRVLEPSCGEAAFLCPAAQRLRGLGVKDGCFGSQLSGCDVHGESIATARELLAQLDAEAQLEERDSLQIPPCPDFDAVVGNPPYVRYQAFSGDARVRGLEAAL